MIKDIKGDKGRARAKVYPKFPKTKKQKEEFGAGKTDYLICPRCHCVYFDKSWHRSLEQDIKKLTEEKRVKFQICPACQMIKDEKFEGEVIVENVLERFKEGIKRLAENFGKRAQEVDPMDKIISVEEKTIERPTTERKRGVSPRKEFKGKRDLHIFTTENQLAVRLAKKIDEIFGGKPDTEISHSEKEDIIRIRIKIR